MENARNCVKVAVASCDRELAEEVDKLMSATSLSCNQPYYELPSIENCGDGNCTTIENCGGKCTTSEKCVDGNCTPIENCDDKCKSSEKCVDGNCTPIGNCDDKCKSSEKCVDGKCTPIENCDGKCKSSEKCVDGKCKSSATTYLPSMMTLMFAWVMMLLTKPLLI